MFRLPFCTLLLAANALAASLRPTSLPASCSNTSYVEPSCSFESPGGVLMQTQFWDYNPSTGPEHDFTIHGLWPDNCDGTYSQFCNASLEITEEDVYNIIVGQYNDHGLYKKMQKYWKNEDGDDAELWIHEFNKHGTCINTIDPACYPGEENKNVYDFYKITMERYEKLPTYKFLKREGIVPSESRNYTKSEIDNALSKNFGGNKVYFGCDDNNALSEVWYYFHIQGALANQDFIPIPSLTEQSCPDEGIRFIPKKK